MILLYLYSLSLVVLAFTLSTFFSKARMATIVGPFVSIVPSVIYIPVKDASLSSSTQTLLSILLPPLGLTLGLDRITQLENKESGLQYSNINSSGVEPYLIGIVLSVLVYFFLAVYLDAVMPGEYGVKRVWYFPLLWVFGRRNGRQEAVIAHAEESNAFNPNVEEEPKGVKRIEIMGLRKVYNEGVKTGTNMEKVALCGLDWSIFEGEIFGLLG